MREERELADAIASMPLAAAIYKQFPANRRVLQFGGRYDFSSHELLPTEPLPPPLSPLRERIARVVRMQPEQLTHATIAEYRPQTQLGWHRDVPDFELVTGVSLGPGARMQFRPYPPQPGSRASLVNALLEPRSLYVLQGALRWEWQHRIPPVPGLRYSITFRALRSTG